MWRKLTGDNFGHDPVSLSVKDLAALPTRVMFLEDYDGVAVGDKPVEQGGHKEHHVHPQGPRQEQGE